MFRKICSGGPGVPRDSFRMDHGDGMADGRWGRGEWSWGRRM